MSGKKLQLFLGILMSGMLALSGCGSSQAGTETGVQEEEHASEEAVSEERTTQETEGEAAQEQVASKEEMADALAVVEEGMTPVYGDEVADGVYSVTVDSSSSMFQIVSCELTVSGGEMRAVMTMSGQGYLKLFMGTGEDAVKASEEDYIPFVETADGAHTFEVPVEALDMGIDCSAFSKRKEKWYDRVLVFRADSLPDGAMLTQAGTNVDSLQLKDGDYTAEVTLAGGSGRASVESPAALRVEDGKLYARLVWGSSNYDYMKVGEVQYDPLNTEGNSTFEIPVTVLDAPFTVLADTTAMSTPHEIEYTLTFDLETLQRVEE